MIAAAAPNYSTLCVCIAAWSFGAGGNFPVDSTIFLGRWFVTRFDKKREIHVPVEFVPTLHRYMLTVLAVWWALGNMLGSLVRDLKYHYIEFTADQLDKIAWPLISNYPCPSAPEPCPLSSNKGWRYYLLAMGGLTMVIWIIRLFAFDLPESPMYLISRGRDEDSVAVVHRVAKINGNTSNLTMEKLKEAEILVGEPKHDNTVTSTSIMRNISEFLANHVRPLFVTRVSAHSMSILIIVWGKD